MQAEHITEAMTKHLTGTDKERKAFLKSMYFSLSYHTLLPLVIAMFQKYREICPDKLELLRDQASWDVSTKWRYKKSNFNVLIVVKISRKGAT